MSDGMKAEIYEWLKSIVIAVAIAFVLRSFVVERFVVEGPSMQPTLHAGESLLVDKLSYRFHPPQRGDIIIFKYPADPSRNFVKRVIAVGGDTIEVNHGKTLVNGQVLPEPYVLAPSRIGYPVQTVPPGTIFVMGDNRNNSEDSRFPDVGFVPLNMVIGKTSYVFWPPQSIRHLQ